MTSWHRYQQGRIRKIDDEENQQVVGDGSRSFTSVYHHTGRQYYLGARYKF